MTALDLLAVARDAVGSKLSTSQAEASVKSILSVLAGSTDRQLQTLERPFGLSKVVEPDACLPDSPPKNRE